VDLDNSLLRIDVLAEWAIRLLLLKPFVMLRLLVQRPDVVTLKSKIGNHFSIRPEILPYNTGVIALIEERKRQGGDVVIASATLQAIAEPIAQALQITKVYASQTLNLKGENKRDALVTLYGEGGFDYVGDSEADVPVWRAAKTRFFAGPPQRLSRFQSEIGADMVDLSVNSSLKQMLKGLRLSHWVKNLLLAVPVVLAGNWGHAQALILLAAFFGFSLVASGLYLVNDLLDVDADRAHPQKRFRPIASGDLAARNALVWAFSLVLTGLAISLVGSGLIGFALTAAYAIGSLGYSLKIKTIPYIDILGLAALYVFRIVAGAIVTSTFISFWMMIFAFMTFSALAALKRVTELSTHSPEGKKSLFISSRRGYVEADLGAVKSLAAGFSVSSITLLGIYCHETFTSINQSMASLLLVGSYAIWLLKFWLDLSRGRLSHDPIKHALSDRSSIVMLAVTFGLYFWLSWSF
jgi:4-hydroxybenzoate polyprenyltransferase